MLIFCFVLQITEFCKISEEEIQERKANTKSKKRVKLDVFYPSFCYFWHEGLGQRGSSEMGSCILNYLRRLKPDSNVIFYSDNCSGQQKNRYLLFFSQLNLYFLDQIYNAKISILLTFVVDS